MTEANVTDTMTFGDIEDVVDYRWVIVLSHLIRKMSLEFQPIIFLTFRPPQMKISNIQCLCLKKCNKKNFKLQKQVKMLAYNLPRSYLVCPVE